MSQILLLPEKYSAEELRFDRVFPLVDSTLQDLIIKVNNQQLSFEDHNFLDRTMTIMNMREAITRNLFEEFKTKFQESLEKNSANSIRNLDLAVRKDICLGCTQYIDTLYMKNGPTNIQVLEKEYIYHKRLAPKLTYKTLETLEPGIPLIISQPFYYGTTHVQMTEILNRCLTIDTPVHIDGAWITSCKNINVDFSHPAIESFAVSMSKGYGLSGWNRIGVRWTKDSTVDAITIMNDFIQIPAQMVAVGLYFLNQVEPGHLWNTHADNYKKICEDFNLTPTDSIHLAMQGNSAVGIESLLRFLEAHAK